MCEKAWDEGVPFPAKPIERSVYMNPSRPQTCRQKLEGTDKIVLVSISRMDREGFLNDMKSRLLTAPPPLTEDNRGVQTWMVYSNAKGKHQFVANKVFSFLEIGTNHSSMAQLVKPERVHAAGEFRIPTALGKYHLNFQSGSQMVDIIKAPDVLKCGVDAQVEYAFEKMKPQFGGAEVENKASTPFIGPEETKKWTNIKQEELDRQKKWGADVYLFDEDEKNVCANWELQIKGLKPGASPRQTLEAIKRLVPRDEPAAPAPAPAPPPPPPPPPPPAPEPKPASKARKAAEPAVKVAPKAAPPAPTDGIATRTRARKAATGKGRRTRRKTRRFSTRRRK